MTDRDEMRKVIARALCRDPDELVDAFIALGEPTDYPAWMLAQPMANKILTALDDAGWQVVRDELHDDYNRSLVAPNEDTAKGLVEALKRIRDNGGHSLASRAIAREALSAYGKERTTNTTELREALAKATPGPWRLDRTTIYAHIHQEDGLHWLASLVIGAGDGYDPDSSRGMCDGRLIVAAINALPALLDELDLLRAGAEDQEPTT